MAASVSSSSLSISSGAPRESVLSLPSAAVPRGPALADKLDSNVFVKLDSGTVVVVPRHLVPLSKLLLDVVVDYDTTESDPFPCLNKYTEDAFNKALKLLEHVRVAWEWVYQVRGAEKMSDLPAWEAVQASVDSYRAEMGEGAREVLSWLLTWPMPDLSTGRTAEGAWYCSRGDLDMFNAAEKGWLGGVQLLRRCGEFSQIRIDAMDKDTNTPLNLASQNGHKDVCEALIAAGAAVNRKDGMMTALHVAAENGHEEVCEVLIGAGADVNKLALWWGELETALYLAARHGHKEVCEVLTGAGADVDKLTDEGMMTALHAATRHGHKEVCEVLIGAGADVNILAGGEWTALHVAAENGHKEVCEVLIGAGADVNKLTEGGIEEEMTALYLAARHGHKEVCEVLIGAGADVDKLTETALHVAAENGRKEVCEVLIGAGADVNKLTGGGGGETALHVAAENGRKEVCEVLIGAGADVNKLTEEEEGIGETALHVAARNGHKEVCEVLIGAGADVKFEA